MLIVVCKLFCALYIGKLNPGCSSRSYPRSVGLANCYLPLKRGGGTLWTENFKIWGLVNWKFPNLGACELKISKFRGLRTKIWAKIEAVEAKISKFSHKGGLVNWLFHFCLKWAPCELQERHEKGVFDSLGPYPFSRSVPPGHHGHARSQQGQCVHQCRRIMKLKEL